MTLLRRRDAAAGLAAVLEEERRILLDGRYGELAGLIRRKEAAVERLGQAADAATAAALRAAAARNARLLEAALSGLRSAIRRRNAPPAGAAALRTYGRDGASVLIGGPNLNSDRRA